MRIRPVLFHSKKLQIHDRSQFRLNLRISNFSVEIGRRNSQGNICEVAIFFNLLTKNCEFATILRKKVAKIGEKLRISNPILRVQRIVTKLLVKNCDFAYIWRIENEILRIRPKNFANYCDFANFRRESATTKYEKSQNYCEICNFAIIRKIFRANSQLFVVTLEWNRQIYANSQFFTSKFATFLWTLKLDC